MQEDGKLWGFFVSAEGSPCHRGCLGRFSLLCVGLAVSAYSKGGPSSQQGGEELGRHS